MTSKFPYIRPSVSYTDFCWNSVLSQRRRQMCTKIVNGKSEGKRDLEDLYVDNNIILNWILRKLYVCVCVCMCVCVCVCVCVCEDVDWVYLILYIGWRQALDNTVAKLRLPTYHTLRLEKCLCTTLKWAGPEVAVNKLSNVKVFSRWRESKQPYLLISTESVVPAPTTLREYLRGRFLRDHFPFPEYRVRRRKDFYYVHSDMQLLPFWRRLRDLPK